MRNILVTGASGFLGSHIIEQLVATDNQVLAAIMPQEQAHYHTYDSVEIVLNDAIFEGKVTSIDCVINCAFSRSNNAADLADGLRFTRQLIAGLEKCKAKALINISSQGVYKRLPQEELSHEDSPIEPLDLYSMAKYAVEQTLLLSQIPHVTNVRLASLNMKQRFTYKFVESVREGRPIALNSPNVYASILDVTDAAKALTLMAQTDPQQWENTYNLGTGNQLSLQQWAEAVQQAGKQLGYTPSIEIQDNGNNSTAGMAIQRLQQLITWKPQKSASDMALDMFNW